MSSSSLLRRLFLLRPFSSAPSPQTLNPNPNAFTEPLNTIIDKLIKQHNPDKLVASFISASTSSYRFRCRHRVYEIAVLRLASSGRRDAVHSILHAQKPFLSSDHGLALRLISLYGKASMPSHAADTFRDLPSLGVPQSTKSFNALLTAFSNSGDFDSLNAAFRDIPAENPAIVPDIFSYNILVKALCERSDFDAAFGALETMGRKEISPDVITMNTLLQWSYELKRPDTAEKVWALMKEKKIEPDARSFNTKLRWLVSEGELRKAVELLSELQRVGPKPDASSFNALIKGYCQEGNLEEAKKVFLELQKNDCVPNRGTFEALVPLLCESGELELAVKYVYDSMSRRCFLDSVVLQQLVDALFKASKVEEATKVVELGRRNNYSRKNLKMPSASKVS